MIKDFSCYRKKERIAGNQTMWEKFYDDGLTAWVTIDDNNVTRQKVIDAFNDQEYHQHED